jgi:hypothetical protein
MAGLVAPGIHKNVDAIVERSDAVLRTAMDKPGHDGPIGLNLSCTSVPNPKFAILCSGLRANFGFDKDTSNSMILVSFMDQKFARWTRGNGGANF